MLNKRLLSTAICAALIGPFAAASAFAQDTGSDKEKATELDKVVVTGSLIPQAQVETATPTITITAEDITRKGFRNVYDVLRAQPLATGAVQDNQFSGGFTSGATTISLLGLPPDFTLVLIDGHPLADYPLLYNGQSNIVDLSTIPTAMVERIDIVPGNQSSIYGSSAIAGVVNIILKKKMEGVELNLRAGGYSEGGGENQRVQVTGGHSWDKLDLVYGFQYYNQKPIYGFDRNFADSTEDNPLASVRYGSRTFVHNDFGPFFNQSIYVTPPDGCGALSGLFGGTTIQDFRPKRGDGLYCGSRAEPGYTGLLNRERSTSGYLNLNFHVNDNTTLYGNVLYNRGRVENNGGTRFWQPSIDTNGYFFNGDTGDFESFQHIFAPEETGGVDTNISRDDTRSYNAVVGIKGNFGGSDWAYDAYFNRSDYRLRNRQLWPLKAKIDQFFEDQFLGPQQGDVYGYPVYTPNVAGFFQAVTPAEYASFQGQINSPSSAWTQNINAQINNPSLFKLPAGDVGFAALVQAGKQSWANPTDPGVVNGDYWGLTGTQGAGERTNQAAAVEFLVPIFSKLTGDISGRYDHYKNQGGSSDAKATYRLGLEFRPVDSLLLRANYATAFKAPDLAYVYAGQSGFFQGVIDYYRCATQDPANTIQNCRFNTVSTAGTRIGNDQLESITAKSYGFGAVWSPSANFNARVDYYNVNIDNEVSDISTDQLLQTESACRLGQLDITSPSCVDAITRITRSNSPNQTLQSIHINPINISKESVSGITAAAAYGWDTGSWGKFDFGLDYNVTLSHKSKTYPADPTLELLSEPFYSSEFRSIVSGDIGWEIGRWTASIHGIRYGRTPNYSAQIDTLGYGAPCDLNQLCPGRIGAYTVYNGSLKYEFSKDLSLSLIGNNLRNSEPPNDSTYTAYPFYNIFNYNGYQRSYWLELNWRFGAGN